MKQTLWERSSVASSAIRERDQRSPKVALVLGSGLGAMADALENKTVIPFEEIPGFPVSSVVGHAGELVIGEHAGLTVVAMKGRVHLYEGHGADTVVFPLRVLWRLGARTLIITNAAGGIEKNLQPGDLVALEDHLNLTGQNPLTGVNDNRFGPRFPDMTEAYDRKLRTLAVEVAAENGFELKTGVYAGLLGPNYETPAEVRMLARAGADVVGMSTVVEVLVAKHMSMRVLGISCVSNLAAGISGQALSHDEVTETADRIHSMFRNLIEGVLEKLSDMEPKS